MSQMQIFSTAEIDSFRKGGKILRDCLAMLAPLAVPGISTGELDRIAEQFIRDHGAKPAFKGYNGYPATLCTSVNEECVHGIPGKRVLKDGDVISLDCGVLLDGLNTDACVSVGIGKISKEASHLLDVTKAALDAAVGMLRPGIRVGDLSSAIQKVVEDGGLKIIRPLTGHGLGADLHQFPDIPNHGRRGTGAIFPIGTVVAIEPIVAIKSTDIRQLPDRWTLVTEHGDLSSHSEHTLLLTEDGCEVIA